ncbi:hypothetical protein [Altererythrobacter lauratis]|uniref:DUF4142 domain-containing protein n=1 Tax=Alteraurantiacibacter lauratis TaxID=2054627 RepID=A0ABV7EHM7_9SPHN
MMHRHDKLITASAALFLLLGGCARSEGYPSLSIRDSERVTGVIDAAAAAFTPAPATPATLAQLDTLAASARAAHQRFLAAQPTTERLVAGARGSAAGTEGWARAQVAIANLESLRSDTMIALADIDRLHVDAHTGGGDIAETGAALAEINTLVDQQDAVIAALLGQLGG